MIGFKGWRTSRMTDLWSVLEWTLTKGTRERTLRRYGPWVHEVALGKRQQLNDAGSVIVAVVRDNGSGR